VAAHLKGGSGVAARSGVCVLAETPLKFKDGVLEQGECVEAGESGLIWEVGEFHSVIFYTPCFRTSCTILYVLK
jgi:hypothetical protein